MAKFKVKKVRAVSVDQLKLEENVPVYVAIVGKIYKGEGFERDAIADDSPKGKRGRKPGQDMEPPDLCLVRNLEEDPGDGKDYTLVVGAQLKGMLEGTYKNHDYVGRCFQITQGSMERAKNGRNFRRYPTDEIECPSDPWKKAIAAAVKLNTKN